MTTHNPSSEKTFIGETGSFELSPSERNQMEAEQRRTTSESMDEGTWAKIANLWRQSMGLDELPLPYEINALLNDPRVKEQTLKDRREHSVHQELFDLRHAMPWMPILAPCDSSIVFSINGSGNMELVLPENTLYIMCSYAGAANSVYYISFDGKPDIPSAIATEFITGSKTIAIQRENRMFYVAGKRNIYIAANSSIYGSIECWTSVK